MSSTRIYLFAVDMSYDKGPPVQLPVLSICYYWLLPCLASVERMPVLSDRLLHNNDLLTYCLCHPIYLQTENTAV